MRHVKAPYIYASLAILFWGTAASAFKIGLSYLGFIDLLTVSIFFSLTVFLLIAIFAGELKGLFVQTRKEYIHSALLGFLNPFLYYIVVFKAYDLLPAQLAQPLNFIWPVTLVILSVPILGTKLGFKNILALFISFVGVFFISSNGKVDFQFADPFGIILALGSSIVWAIFWLFNTRDKRKEIHKLLTNFFFAFIYIVVLQLILGNFQLPSFKGILSGAYIGTFEMGITFFIWLKALSYRDHTARIGNFIYLTPFVALLFIYIILNEQIFYTTFIGLILIVAGILLQQSVKQK